MFRSLALAALLCWWVLPAHAAGPWSGFSANSENYPPLGSGTEYFVTKTGNDSTGDGSSGNPWLTIQKCLNEVVAGDTCTIGAGTYTESLTATTGGSNATTGMITIRGTAVPPSTIVSGASGNRALLLSSSEPDATDNFIRFHNLGFTGANGAASGGEGVLISGWHDVWLTNVEIFDNVDITSPFTAVEGLIITGTSETNLGQRVIVYDSIVRNNGRGGPFSAGTAEGISLNGFARDITLDNVHSHHNARVGIRLATDIFVEVPLEPACTIENCNVTIRNSEVNDNGHTGISTQRAIRWLIENNFVHHNGITGIQIEAGARWVVVRNNIAEDNNQNAAVGANETGIWFDEDAYVVYEGNILRRNNRGGLGTQSSRSVVRRNIFHDNNGQPGGTNDVYAFGHGHSSQGKGHPLLSQNITVVHNTFFDNGKADTTLVGGIRTNDITSNMVRDLIYKNNIFMDTLGPRVWAMAGADDISTSNFNIWFQTSGATMVFRRVSTDSSGLAAWTTATGLEANSINDNPDFTNTATGDFTLLAGSPAIDAGTTLTTTVGAGTSSTTMVVANPYYFMDGFGITGVQGDLIQLSGQTVTSRITDIEYDTPVAGQGTLTLATALTWSNGQGVSYAYNGTAPDIGAIETESVSDSSLVAYYRFEDNSGTTTSDESGNSNTGTISGAARVNGWNGIGKRFDGVDDQITVTDSASLSATSAVTVMAWVYPRSVGSGYVIVDKRTGSSDGYQLGINPIGSMYFLIDTSSFTTGEVDTILTPGRWYHMAGTWDGTSIRAYLDGAEGGVVGTLTGTIDDGADDLLIGLDHAGAQGFRGLIDDVRVYTRALSPAEIAAFANAPSTSNTPRYGCRLPIASVVPGRCTR